MIMVLLGSATLVGGCNLAPTDQRCETLRQENLELRQVLKSHRQALDTSNRKRGELQLQAAGLESQLATQFSSVATRHEVGANTGFASIEGVETFTEGGRITSRIQGDILFGKGTVSLKQTARQTLSKIAGVLKTEYPNSTIRICGHTDTDPIRKSRWADNLELSLQRAAAVHRYLQKQGVKAKQMYVAGYGPWHPGQTRADSRRVEIVVVPDE